LRRYSSTFDFVVVRSFRSEPRTRARRNFQFVL